MTEDTLRHIAAGDGMGSMPDGFVLEMWQGWARAALGWNDPNNGIMVSRKLYRYLYTGHCEICDFKLEEYTLAVEQDGVKFEPPAVMWRMCNRRHIPVIVVLSRPRQVGEG